MCALKDMEPLWSEISMDFLEAGWGVKKLQILEGMIPSWSEIGSGVERVGQDSPTKIVRSTPLGQNESRFNGMKDNI